MYLINNKWWRTVGYESGWDTESSKTLNGPSWVILIKLYENASEKERDRICQLWDINTPPIGSLVMKFEQLPSADNQDVLPVCVTSVLRCDARMDRCLTMCSLAINSTWTNQKWFSGEDLGIFMNCPEPI